MLRKRIAALALAAASVAGGVGLTASPAAAHSFGAQGPAHTHVTCYPGAGQGDNQCMRWILANGAIYQGPLSLMIEQYGYVLVWCSYQNGNGTWSLNTASWGPWNNTGWHTYCQNPKYSGTAWSLRP